MRVAHIVSTFLPASETFIYTQLRAQSDLEQAVFARDQRNANIFPFAPVHVDLVSRQASRILSRLPAALQPTDPFATRDVRPIRRFGADVLHAHFGWAGVKAIPAATKLSLPLVVAFHGRDVYAPASVVADAPKAYLRLFEVGTIFTCVGPSAGAELRRLGCPPERLRLVPVGIDLADFTFAPAKPSRPLILIQVGRLVEKKGVDTTIRAYARARSRLGDSELWIVGEGPERKALEAAVQRLGVSESVKFWGMLAPADVRTVMARAHIGIQPSRTARDGDREGTPTVIIEMQARGIDLVATRHTDIPFIVPFPDRLVSEDDADELAEELVRLAELTPAERGERLTAARSFVEQQHDALQIRALIREIYDEAIAIGGAAG